MEKSYKEKFEEIGKRLEKLDDRLWEKLDGIEKRIEALEAKCQE